MKPVTFYKKFVKEYDSRNLYNLLYARWLFANIIKQINKEKSRILDLGTGTGELAIRIAKKFPKSEIIGKEKDFLNDTYRKLFGRFFPLDRVDFFNLKPRLVLCESQEEKDIWKFFRIVQSSLPLTGRVGRSMKYLLIDSDSNCVMGILELSSDLASNLIK